VSHCTLLPLGDRAFTVAFPDLERAAARDVVRCLTTELRTAHADECTDIVRAIDTVTVHYDPSRISDAALRHIVHRAVESLRITPVAPRPPIDIPVCYDDELGPDLAAVAAHHHTTAEAIIAAHSSASYTVAMIGFLPGFPYLDGLPSTLHTPRRATPRTLVPAGSVGIGDASTGVYSCDSPGGWQIIGRTPLAMFDATRDTHPALLAPDDPVRFIPISRHEYDRSVRRA
jgi:KipI family sensor histidine kinase inhibitor